MESLGEDPESSNGVLDTLDKDAALAMTRVFIDNVNVHQEMKLYIFRGDILLFRATEGKLFGAPTAWSPCLTGRVHEVPADCTTAP
jgi:hypothetical protein